ncbi:MAG: dockerin type I domain-containing protein [Deltaproteobacteria bacterium]|nr:dockerin type I domain-containing protein [Deltaproteobacteria bacterium]
MKKSSRSLLIIGLLVFVASALIPVNSFADVDVYGEGAYTESDLVVYIYADINSPTELRSAGVKLTYETAALTVDTAEKNDSDWFLGSESYMDPDMSTAGEVVIILGKLDTGDATAGVSGDRVLLGKVRFNRTGSSIPFSPTLDLALGKVDPYANFVDTAEPTANVLDDTGVNFGTIIIAKRGDANADGNITMADAMFVKHMFQSGLPYVCYADANSDDGISMADAMLIKHIFQTGG